MRPQLRGQGVEHARRELELHEFIGQLLARLLRARIVRALLGQPRQHGIEVFADQGHAARDFFRIRTGVDDLVLAVPVLRLVLVGLLALDDDVHLGRILRLCDDVGSVRVDEADHQVDHARLAGLELLVGMQQVLVGGRIVGERQTHRVQALLYALGNADFTFACQQLHRAHLAHVHAHRVGGAAEFRIQCGQCCRCLFDGFLIRRRRRIGCQQRLGVRYLLVYRNAHVVNRVDDILDLLRIDDLRRQMIVDLRVGEVSLLLAARDQQLQLRLPVFRHDADARDR